jgi:hypothetical protein
MDEDTDLQATGSRLNNKSRVAKKYSLKVFCQV